MAWQNRRPFTLITCGAILWSAAGAAAQDTAFDWQSSAGTLTSEKQRAETCVSILKRHTDGNEAARSRGQLAYSGAKAESDAAIVGLTMALAQGQEAPGSLTEIEGHLARAGEEREEFCAYVIEQLPDEDGNSRIVIADVLAKSVPALIDAGKDLFLNYRKETLIRRESIGNQIEAQKWRAFEDIPQ